MYKLPHFTENNLSEIHSFLLDNPFATLTGIWEGAPVATQIPVLIASENGQITLRGHVMRNTDHYKAIKSNSELLILFTGPQCYVSASWYNERGHGSTWNYMTVQARGKATLYSDEETIQLLQDLTHRFEDTQVQPELLEHMTTDYVQSNVKAIQGFEIPLTDIHATFKLSQNRNDESYKNIVKHLEAIAKPGELRIAKEMRKRRPQLFQGI